MIEKPWSQSFEVVAEKLQTDANRGLSSLEAERRLQQYGYNRLEAKEGIDPLKLFFRQFFDLMIGLLVVAAVISAWIGEWTDTILIALIVVANAVIGFVQEWRAEKAVAALKAMTIPHAQVWRDGNLEVVSVEMLVPGDVVEVRAGDFVPADVRVIEAADCELSEAALTGESLPVEKNSTPNDEETVLPERSSMLFSGTAVASGHAKAIVTTTGMQTELGNIATLLQEAKETQTPLQRRLSRLSKRLAVIVIAVAIVIFLVGVLREDRADWNRELFSVMLLTAVSLAVAAIPEGLPAVITITLALGSQRMVGRNAIVRKLSAVETLGSVDYICSDKTGTLTQNKMEVADIVASSKSNEARLRLLEAGALCNDAEISGDGEIVGSATEAAILKAAGDAEIDIAELRKQQSKEQEIPFSSARKRMTTLHRTSEGKSFLYLKGAGEQILQRCDFLGTDNRPFSDEERDSWNTTHDELVARGRRVLGIAFREYDEEHETWNADGMEENLTFLGFVGIIDPIRPEAKESIALCRSAGIKPVMITGDHPGTARAIADDLALREPDDEILTGLELEKLTDEELQLRVERVSVYARVTPEHKLRIVQALQSRDHTCAMTGDGVNDAPALKQADIGVAMGITGTDVAKESADMILADDNFATIVSAVEQGRAVYDNIRKFVGYLLTANTGEILVLFFAIVAGMPLPLLPIHILWINLVTDGLPAIALGFEPAENNLMKRKPRKKEESIFANGMVSRILTIGLLMGTSCVALHWVYIQNHAIEYARTLVFFTLAMYQLIYVLAIRSESESFFRLGLWSNYRLTCAVILGVALQFAVVYVPSLQQFFHTVPLEIPDMLIGLVVSTLAFWLIELQKRSR